MNIMSFSTCGHVFVNVELIHGVSFKNAVLRDNCALLPVICANFALSQDSYAHLNPIECLSLYNSAT